MSNLKSYYDSKGIITPTDLQPREIELYESLSEENSILSKANEALNQQFESTKQELVEKEKKLKSRTIKDYGIVIASGMLGLGVLFGTMFVQESQRNQELLRQIDTLKASEVIQENNQLKNKIETLENQVEALNQQKRDEDLKFYLIVLGSGCIGILMGISGTFLLIYLKK
ncbi:MULTISPECIES: hypothetical protein [Nostocales]|uniref:Uncharacterized protein n=3 Tax=Nostocales TaxID=1161 RepID=A0A0C1R9W2_9CYAN|nr:hypothetical protein [Tolypothrix bouteillei]KAF3885208.1 hypothetical protein DA73_0400006850 [Tolypothrix bouteillei VB521301]